MKMKPMAVTASVTIREAWVAIIVKRRGIISPSWLWSLCLKRRAA